MYKIIFLYNWLIAEIILDSTDMIFSPDIY